jgi:translation initiation factor IF-1
MASLFERTKTDIAEWKKNPTVIEFNQLKQRLEDSKQKKETFIFSVEDEINRNASIYKNRANIRDNINMFDLKKHLISQYKDVMDAYEALGEINRELGVKQEYKQRLENHQKNLEYLLNDNSVSVNLYEEDVVKVEPKISDTDKTLADQYFKLKKVSAYDSKKALTPEFLDWKKDYL